MHAATLESRPFEVPRLVCCTAAGLEHPILASICHSSACSELLCGAGEAFERIEGLLLHSIASPSEAPRLCAVQWACALYPFSSPVARWICVLAAGDAKLEVREAGAKGLMLPPSGSAGEQIGRTM